MSAITRSDAPADWTGETTQRICVAHQRLEREHQVEYLPLAATRLYLGCSGAKTGQWDVFVREFGT